jgi:uncharacterized YigZ family protein
MYKIPAKRCRAEETIKRSRFIATVAHAPTEEEAKAFIAAIRSEFPDATHNCWAYVTGPPGDTARVGMSDDGEPHGTAGRPMLSVLLYSDIGEIVAVVTRYYGGVKLGTGGLVRAYSGTLKKVLAGLSVKEKRDLISLTVAFDYSRVAAVKKMIESFDSEITGENYGADVTLTIEIPKERKDTFVSAVTDLTRGEVRIVD